MQKVPSFLLRCLLNCGRVSIFAPQSRTKASQIGRLAQLVQSVCLTSRGSGVRIPQRPHSFRQLSIGRWVAVFLCANETREGGGSARKFGGQLCAYPALAGCAVVCLCVGAVGCSFVCEEVCSVFESSWCLLLEKPIDGWRCFRKKTERKREKMGDVERFFPCFLSDFSHNRVRLSLADSKTGIGQGTSPGSDEKKRFALCACRLFRNAALLLFRMRRERRVEVRGG